MLLSPLHMPGTAQSLQEFTAVRVLEEASEPIWAAAWSQNLLATAGNDKTVRIYDSDQDREREVRLGVRCRAEFQKKNISSKTSGVGGSWIVSLSSIFKLSLGLIQRCGVFVAVVSNILQVDID